MRVPQQYEQQNRLQPQQTVRQVAPEADLSGLAKGVEALGQTFYNWQDELDTADGMAADVKYGEFLEQALYADGSGYMYSQGGDAVARRESVAKLIDEKRDSFLDGLTPGARAQAEKAIRLRATSTKSEVNRHAAGQGREYANQQTDAQIGLYMQQSITRPDEAESNLKAVEGYIYAQAEREGWAPEVTQLKVAAARSGVHRGIAERLAVASPMAALDYLNEKRGEFLGEDLAALEKSLAPAAKAEKGRIAGSAAAGATGYTYSTNVEYGMGPARPYKPNGAVVDVIGMAAEDAFGKGARVVVTSGQEGDKTQHGSNRHKTGNAADIAIYRPDGTKVKATDPDAKAFALAAAKRGAKGIGFGAEYMGGEHFHVDLIGADLGGGNTWATGGKAISGEFVGAMGEFAGFAGGGVEALLDIEDPEVRAAAIAEYNLREGVRVSKLEAQQSAATQAAFELIETGNSVDTLPLEFRQSLGMEGMNKLRSYQSSKANGEKVTTDPVTYMTLRRLAENDPEAFINTNVIGYLDKLSESDLKGIIDLQSAKMDERSKGVKSAQDASVSSMRSEMTPYLRAAGYDLNDKKGAAAQVKAEAAFMRWHDNYVAVNKAAPSAAERSDFMRRAITTEVTLDPTGFNNSVTGNNFAIEYNGKPVQLADGTVGRGGAFKLSDVESGSTSLALNSLTVPQAEIKAATAAYRSRYGVEPELQDIINMLIATGDYN